ncbi:phospholipase B domain-containing protein [Ditylenchus destructor]|uniref:Phospholipase B-like n=1 Tax=Ditylenchus destructor TaxID=166010 RepID=A0AAD4NFR8_9BILA|nr:phospholipase B domain-containing protein [Ditylenchus destructor]
MTTNMRNSVVAPAIRPTLLRQVFLLAVISTLRMEHYKGTNYENFKKLRIHAVGGPTYDPLPPFDWRTTNIVAKHAGQPLLWNFRPFITEWETSVEVDL